MTAREQKTEEASPCTAPFCSQLLSPFRPHLLKPPANSSHEEVTPLVHDHWGAFKIQTMATKGIFVKSDGLWVPECSGPWSGAKENIVASHAHILWKQQCWPNFNIPIHTHFFTELSGTVFQLPYNLLHNDIILCMSAHWSGGTVEKMRFRVINYIRRIQHTDFQLTCRGYKPRKETRKKSFPLIIQNVHLEPIGEDQDKGH